MKRERLPNNRDELDKRTKKSGCWYALSCARLSNKCRCEDYFSVESNHICAPDAKKPSRYQKNRRYYGEFK